jgi:hypothetical protein
MLELLRDGVWQAIGAVFSVAAIIVTFAIHRWQLQKSAFTYLVKSAYPLLKSTEELQGRLSVQVDNIAVRNIDVMFIEFQNSGNRPIARTDFDVPVSIAFKPPVRIISAVLDAESPQDLGVSLQVEEQQVTIIPMLLNPNDGFTLKLLLSSDSLKYAVSGRIVGVKQIEELKPSNSSVRLLFALVFCLIGFVLFLYSIPRIPDQPRPPIPVAAYFGLGMVGFGYLLMVLVLIKRGVFRRLKYKFANVFRSGERDFI